MARMNQFRSVRASLWQSAVDEAVAQQSVGASPAAGFGPRAGGVKRPDLSDESIAQADAVAQAIAQGVEPPQPPPPSPAVGFTDVVKFCSVTAFRLAEARVTAILTGDDSELKRLERELKVPFGSCDPKWAQVIAIYVAQRLASSTIPYRRHSSLDDFVIDGRLPDPAKVAILGDWGTGQDGARSLLRKIAARQCDAVIHLGDVYYSGTEHEMRNYFYAIWQKVLGIPKVEWGSKPSGTPSRPATFTLAGNHDMYAGGGPYYTLIDMLGQPASYFCLRNNHWQFIAMDTGLHDANPVGQEVTFLEDSEVAWIKHKVQNAGGRKTVLLSHHQLFSAFEKMDGKSVNDKLLGQLEEILPQVTVWFWGHEHNLTIYKRFQNVLARCVGHGAFPVGVDDKLQRDFSVPIEDSVKLNPDQSGALFQHGYAILELNGPTAQVTYFEYDDGTDRETALHSETL